MSNVIGFYNQNDSYGCFSNFYHCRFTVDGIIFTSSEQYMMFTKACLFGDREIAFKILSTHDCKTIKAYGREVRGYNDAVWGANRFELVKVGLYEKFNQNEDLKKILLSTDDATLAECAGRDRIWGIGLSVSNPNVQNPSLWRGQNLMGKCLMDVRSMLKNKVD